MGRTTEDERLTLLLAKKARLKAQLKELTARQSAREKRINTRRKILVGAAVLIAAEKGDAPFLRQILNQYVSREADRRLLSDLIL